MLDSLCLSPFRFGDIGKKKGNPFAFHMLSNGSNLFDGVTGTQAACSVSGIRWVKRNGVIVSVGPNEIPVEDDGLRGCTALTQQAKYTETLTNAIWAKTGTNVLTEDIAVQGKKSWVMREDSTTGVHRIFFNDIIALADNAILGFCGIFKSSNRHIDITIRDKTNTNNSTRIDLSTGSVAANANTFIHVDNLGNGYYRCFVAKSVSIGATTPLVLLYRTKSDGIQSYTGDNTSSIIISQPTIINFGVGVTPFIPPYIPNDTGGAVSVVSEAATATTGTSFDLDGVKLSRAKSILRGPNAQGHIEFKLKLNFNRAWKATNTPILSVNNDATGDFLYYSVAETAWSTYDISGNRAQINMPSFDVGQTVTFAIDFGTHSTGQKQRLTVNGVKSSLAAFSGSWGSNDLRFFYNAGVHAGWIVKDSLKIMDRPQW